MKLIRNCFFNYFTILIFYLAFFNTNKLFAVNFIQKTRDLLITNKDKTTSKNKPASQSDPQTSHLIHDSSPAQSQTSLMHLLTERQIDSLAPLIVKQLTPIDIQHLVKANPKLEPLATAFLNSEHNTTQINFSGRTLSDKKLIKEALKNPIYQKASSINFTNSYLVKNALTGLPDSIKSLNLNGVQLARSSESSLMNRLAKMSKPWDNSSNKEVKQPARLLLEALINKNIFPKPNSNLETLDVSNGNLKTGDIKYISENFPSLKTLIADGNNLRNTESYNSDLKYLFKQLPNLEKLSLKGCQLKPGFGLTVGHSGHSYTQKLRDVDLSDNQLNNHTVRSMSELFAAVQKLNLSKNPLGNDIDSMDFRNFASLKALDLSETQMNDNGFKIFIQKIGPSALLSKTFLSQLEELNLSNNRIGDDGASNLLEIISKNPNPLQNLTSLKLKNTNITPDMQNRINIALQKSKLRLKIQW